jgi:hypothetical protein
MRDLRRRTFLNSLAGASATMALATGLLRGRDALAGDPALQADPEADAKKVSILGDSMIAGGFGLYLEQALEKKQGHAVARHGKSSTGLARPDFYDWIKQGRHERESQHPDAVVVMFGGNDGQGLWMGKKAEPKWIRYEEENWTPEYRRRVNAFADTVTGGGETLIWIGMPVMRPSKLHKRVGHMNDIYRAEMAIRPRAHFVDIWPLLADAAGKYTDHVKIEGKRVRVRAQDGVHLSRSGAHHLVGQVAPKIADILGAKAV